MTVPLWRIFVPTSFGDTQERVSLDHHQLWDEFVIYYAGGLTINNPFKGKWLSDFDSSTVVERLIPVDIATSRENIDRIIDFTIKHYRQRAVMAYKVSDEVIFKNAN